MKLIKPSFKILDHSVPDKILEQIEEIARVCYKSEDRIKPGSAEVLVKSLIKNEHNAMLEFGYHPIFNIDLHSYGFEDFTQVLLDAIIYSSPEQYDPTCRYFNLSFDKVKRSYLLSASIRVYKAFMEYFKYDSFGMLLAIAFNKILPNYLLVDSCTRFGTPCAEFELISISELTQEERLIHEYPTVKFICDRGISHELVRHRPCGFAMESTRYCNYGEDHIEFIIPPWTTLSDQSYVYEMQDYDYMNSSQEITDRMFSNFCLRTEEVYDMLLDQKWKPEQARNVLPMALKTEVVVVANHLEWQHIFKQRCAPNAHPQMRELMIPLQETFNKIYYE